MIRNYLFPFLLPLIAGVQGNPKIVYINADELGWTELGAQGSTHYKTSNIDQLADSAIRCCQLLPLPRLF